MKTINKTNMVIFVFVLGIGLTLGDVSWVYAQETEEFTLEEITVTAQKREENQQKVPMAMEVISAEEIKDLGKNNIDEILSKVSSAIIQKAEDGYRVSIRGMADYLHTMGPLPNSLPSVAINADGIYSTRKDRAGALFDVERVEVLLGPQSTLYSSNSPGGIVNIITAQPKTDVYEISGMLEYGSYNLLHTEGAMNAPLSDKAAIRASFTTSVRDGYVTNGYDNEDTKSARVRALLQPNDKISFTATAELSRNKGHGFGGGVVPFVDQDDSPNPWTGAESGSAPDGDQTGKRLYGQMNWDTGLGALSLTPSYSTTKGTTTSVMMGSATYYDLSGKEKSIELRMTSTSDFPFKWIAGVTYYHSVDSSSSLSENYVETGVGSWGILSYDNNNKAIFANITYPVTDRFRLTAGYRKSWDKYITHDQGVDMFTLAYSDLYWRLDTNGLADYKFGFEYDLGENSMFYADYATSYRLKGMGKPNELAEKREALAAAPPEYLNAYSFGSKNRFFGNKLQINGSAYYYDYKNYEAGGESTATVWFEDTNNNQLMDRGEFDTDPWAGSIGDGHMMGFDLQASAIITPKDILNLSISYENSEWTKLFFHYYWPSTLKIVNGEVVRVPMPELDYKGKPMMMTPPWTITLNYSHNFNLGNGGIIKANITSKYRTGFRLSWNDEDYPHNYQEPYHLEDVSATYNPPDGKWTLSAYVNNISNYAEKRLYRGNPRGIGAGTMSIGDPRTYGAVLSVKY